MDKLFNFSYSEDDIAYVTSLDTSGVVCSMCQSLLQKENQQNHFHVHKHVLCSKKCLKRYQEKVQPIYIWIEKMKQSKSSYNGGSSGGYGHVF